jgi:hypothetical protein
MKVKSASEKIANAYKTARRHNAQEHYTRENLKSTYKGNFFVVHIIRDSIIRQLVWMPKQNLSPLKWFGIHYLCTLVRDCVNEFYTIFKNE